MATRNTTAGPKVLFGAPKAPTPKSNTPRVAVTGVLRNRIEATREAILEFDATASDDMAGTALAMINAVNLDDNHFEDTVNFGADLQEAHAALSQSELAVIENDALARARTLSMELFSLFDRLDPRKIFDIKGGVFAGLKNLVLGGSPQEQFDVLVPLISDLASALQSQSGGIGSAHDALRQLADRHKRLEQKMTAAVLAARFIVHSIRTTPLKDRAIAAHYKSQADALDVRAGSLISSLSTLALSRQTLQSSIHSVELLAETSSGLMREDLPAWRAAYAAALLARQSGTSDVAAEQLVATHERIAAKLKLKG